MTNLTPGSPGFVERLLADRIGLDVVSVGEGLIVRGIQNRMDQLGVRRLEDYERILLGPTNEIQALIEEVVIPESWFFRDDRPFETFRDFVRAGWLGQPGRPPISILCLPCAGGEEPYSVVITLMELGLARNQFQVTAVDISERSIRRATAGLYGVNAFRGVNLDLQTRYFDFTEVRGRYLLKASVRSAVRFELGNLLDSSLLDDHLGFDVVFCRNLLIYFDESARIKAFANLDRLTAVDGLLFLGHADRPDQNLATRFLPYADSGSFVYRKQGEQRSTPIKPVPLVVDPKQRPAKSSPPKVSSGSATRANPPSAPQVPIARPEPRVRSEAAGSSNSVEAMTQASILADLGRYEEATRIVEEQMSRGSLDASAHFLLGIIHQAAGDRARAEAELTKAIYLDPEHDEALLALALLARRKGDMAAEAVLRRRADRVLARKGRL